MEIKVPAVGESIIEALIVAWHKVEGAPVRKGEVVCELETDKVNVQVEAEADGTLSILVPAGETVKIGAVIGRIGAGAPAAKADKPEPAGKIGKGEKRPAAGTGKPATREERKTAPAPAAAAVLNPAARKLAAERGLDPARLAGSGRDGRVTVDDVLAAEQAAAPAPTQPGAEPATETGRITREKMSPLRQRIAERLVSVRRDTAMLTTFNEADLSRVQGLRRKHGESFQARHGVKLGLMSFFVKACVEALREFPILNARIDGAEIVHQHFYDLGIAVASDRGLVVPVVRDADRLDFAGIERAIAELAEKVRSRRITLAELEGGTFTITNGGIYGSLLSTPMLNPPQCGVLGMHAVRERPVAVAGEVVIRPMMNLALSYDHRLVDGREAVSFLARIVKLIEDPEEMLLEL